MNNEGPTLLNYATPVVRMYWRWRWGQRLGVTALMAVVHFGLGCLVNVYAIEGNLFLAIVLYPAIILIPWLHGPRYLPDDWMLPVLVGESLFVGAMLAALFEGTSRYRHRPNVQKS
jgi:hypothetical protein